MPIEAALTEEPLVLIAAHPDDETLGAGGILPRMNTTGLVYVTDGSPRDPADAEAAGFPTREDYAAARRRELLAALRLAGDYEGSLRCLGATDKEAWLDMGCLARRIAGLLQELRPHTVLTHPYEGGHPDHDATAFAVHAACALTRPAPTVYEFTSYHARNGGAGGGMETGCFLSDGDPGESIVLTAEERGRKTRMIECFASQRHMLRHFTVEEERFRPAPAYDFTRAPHPGRLLYEDFGWRIAGEDWRRAAAEAVKTLGVQGTL